MVEQSRDSIRQQIKDALQKASLERATNLRNAITILQDAAKLVPVLHAEEQTEKKSLKIDTEKTSTLEIFYYNKKGNLHYEICEYSEAKRCFEELKNKLPNNNKSHKALGDALRKLKNYDKALECYNDGLDVHRSLDRFSLLRIKNLNERPSSNLSLECSKHSPFFFIHNLYLLTSLLKILLYSFSDIKFCTKKY